MISLNVASLKVNRPKDAQEPCSYILSGAFDYVFDHRVTVKGAWSGVVGVGVIKGSFQKHLKTGVG